MIIDFDTMSGDRGLVSIDLDTIGFEVAVVTVITEVGRVNTTIDTMKIWYDTLSIETHRQF